MAAPRFREEHYPDLAKALYFKDATVIKRRICDGRKGMEEFGPIQLKGILRVLLEKYPDLPLSKIVIGETHDKNELLELAMKNVYY